MEQLVITGGNRLCGEVSIKGFKNAALAIIPATICARSECIIDNLPEIDDIRFYIDTLAEMNVECKYIDSNTLRIDSTNIKNVCADFESVKKIRASYYMLGALLGVFKQAEVALPGGCNLGSRPIDYHIKGFEALGAEVSVEHGIIRVKADKLTGSTIYLDFASVGATINIMLAAVFATGVTVIENAAKEPHIVDVANFLNILGAKVKGAGTDIIKITGVKNLHGGQYTIVPDQIEAGTFMIAAAATGGDITVTNIIPKHMDSLSAKLGEMGCKITEGDDFIRVVADKPLKATSVKTMCYPGFPTDLQPQMAALMAGVKGTSFITETIYENRFQYINELKRLGANITVDGRMAVIEGPANLTGADVSATDLRAGVALIIAGLAASGDTTIGNVRFIDRGYEHIEDKLIALGAKIRRIK